MCLGIPMRVESATAGVATCAGRGGRRRIATLLVGDCAPGDWLLTFLGDARERISAERAGEIDAVLDLLEMAMDGGGEGAAPFILPSSLPPHACGASLFDPSEPRNERPT